MSNDEPFPAFSESGDPREEALWEAYQAMLRRRNDARAQRPAGVARPADEPPPSARNGSPDLPRPATVAAPHRASPARRGPGGKAIATILTVAAVGALAIGVWTRGHDAERRRPAAARSLRVVTETRPRDVLASRPGLPCFVAGQLIGRLPLDDCARRNGVASGPLEVGLGPPVVAAVPAASPPNPVPAQAGAAAQPPPEVRTALVRPAVGAPGAAQEIPPRKVSPWPRSFGVAPPVPPKPTPGSARDAAPRPRAAAPPSPAPPPVAERWPQIAEGVPVFQSAVPDAEHRPIPQVATRRASVLAVREFYRALGEGDGARAAAVVIPEKRDEGPLSSGELTRFYSSLRAPLRLTRLDPINDDTVFVGYQFVTADNRLCTGVAKVNTTHRDGDTLVQRVRAYNGC